MGHWEDVTDNVCDGYSCGSRYVTTSEWVSDDGDSVERSSGGGSSSGLEIGCVGALSIFGGVCYGLYKLGEYVVDLF